MITRLICLVFAVAIVANGMAEQSQLLVLLAAAIVLVAFVGVSWGGVEPCWRAKTAPTWGWERFSPRALLFGGVALSGSLVTVMIGPSAPLIVVAVLSWLVALGGLIALGLELDGRKPRDVWGLVRVICSREHRPELGSVLAITLVGFVLRVYNLETVPPMFHGDEGFIGLESLEIMKGTALPFFSTSQQFRLPYMFYYLGSLSMAVFGQSVYGVRMFSVLSGALAIPVVYAIGRIGWGPAAGAIAAWLMAVSHLQIHYSRLNISVIQSTTLMAIVVLIILLINRQARRQSEQAVVEPAGSVLAHAGVADADAAASADAASIRVASSSGARQDGSYLWTLILLFGLMVGFSQYFYFASRLIAVIGAPLLALLWWQRRLHLWHLAAGGFAFAVVYAPLVAHYMESPGRFNGRFEEVSIFQDQYARQVVGPNASLPLDLPWLLLAQAQRSMNLLMRAGDMGGFYSGNTPNFDVVTASMIWLGFGVALARLRRFDETVVIAWFVLGLLFSSILTLGAHSGQRLLIMTTAGFLCGGVLVARLWELLQRLPSRGFSWLAAPAGTTLALWLISANVSMYFFEYVPRAEMSEWTGAARELVAGRDRYHTYFLTSPIFDPKHGAIQFIARGIPATNLTKASDFVPPPNDGLGIAIIALDHNTAEMRMLEARIPGGVEKRVNAGNGRVLYYVYRSPPLD